VFYFNTEPRLKWNKIILAAKIILLYFRRHVGNEILESVSLSCKRYRFTIVNIEILSASSKKMLAFTFMTVTRSVCALNLHLGSVYYTDTHTDELTDPEIWRLTRNNQVWLINMFQLQRSTLAPPSGAITIADAQLQIFARFRLDLHTVRRHLKPTDTLTLNMPT